jgi:hypothetical protein
MTAYTIRAEIEVRFHLLGAPDDERETAYPKVDIEFEFIPYQPATGPSYASGGEPACPAEVDFIKATLIDGDGLIPTKEQIDDWSREWLCDAGYDAACEIACRDDTPDPDHARDQALDDRMMGFD